MKVYFDTSTWNHLEDHDQREELIRLIQHGNQQVLASVISVGEVLCTPTDLRRQRICLTMRALHGDGPLLERPVDLAHAAAQATLQEQDDFQLPRSGPGNYLNWVAWRDQSPPQDEIRAWQCNMEENLERFSGQLRQLHLSSNLNRSTEVLNSEPFLKILSQLPRVKDLGLSVPQMRAICEKSDVWKALGATLAYMIKPSTAHAPKYRKRRKRPGARDLWQAAYLGMVEVFVTGDERMFDAVSEISRIARFRFPRCIEMSGMSGTFFACLLSEGEQPNSRTCESTAPK